MSQCIPWGDLADDDDYQGLSADTGHPVKDARCLIGSVIIKHKLSLSDIETIQQIQENPYMQFFVGFASFQAESPFAPSLLVDIRKCMGLSVFEVATQIQTKSQLDNNMDNYPAESKIIKKRNN
jgi:hypothetical protein